MVDNIRVSGYIIFAAVRQIYHTRSVYHIAARRYIIASGNTSYIIIHSYRPRSPSSSGENAFAFGRGGTALAIGPAISTYLHSS